MLIGSQIDFVCGACLENWRKLYNMWCDYHRACKIYSEFSECTLISVIGTVLTGGTLHLHKDVKKPIEAYETLLNEVGHTDNGTGVQIPGQLLPVMIYVDGELIDFRLHLTVLLKTSLGKTKSYEPMTKLYDAVGVYSQTVQGPTTAKLTGMTSEVSMGNNKKAFVPVTPYLLVCDVIIVDECDNLFKLKGEYYANVLPNLRKNMDTLYSSKSAIIHNDSASNTLVRPFYGRATVLAASFPTRDILDDIKKGTLQRTLVLTAAGDQDYTDSIFDAKLIATAGQSTIEKPLHIETLKKKLIREMADIINSRVTSVREHAMRHHQPGHYYLSYRVDKETYNKFISRMKQKKRDDLTNTTDHEILSSFYTRGISHIVKMAAVISIINGQDYAIGEEEYQYAQDLYFKQIENMKQNLDLGLPRQDTMLEYLPQFVSVMNPMLKKYKEKYGDDAKINKEDAVQIMMKVWGTARQTTLTRINKIEELNKIMFVKTGKKNEKKLVIVDDGSDDDTHAGAEV